jgi:hypothetical protein
METTGDKEDMAYPERARISYLEGLVRDLSRSLKRVMEEYAFLGGTTPEQLTSLREEVALVKQAETALLGDAARQPNTPVTPAGHQETEGGHQTPTARNASTF